MLCWISDASDTSDVSDGSDVIDTRVRDTIVTLLMIVKESVD
jgi:hypothetical protein